MVLTGMVPGLLRRIKMSNDLYKGFLVSVVGKDGIIEETLYAVRDEEVLESEPAPSSASFFEGRIWKTSEKSTDWVSENAEYIGYYRKQS